MRITTELRSTGGNTTGFMIPDNVVEELGGGNKPKVKARIGAFEYRTSIARMGEAFWLGLSAERRAETGLVAGAVVEIELELDIEPRRVDVPTELAAALAKDDAARAYWETLSYSNQSWHALQIAGAKSEETRQRRVEKSLSLLRQGKPR